MPAGAAAACRRFPSHPVHEMGDLPLKFLFALQFFFNRSPNTHKNDGCALYFPALFFSTWSRWPVVKPLAWAPPAPAWGSLRCLGMLQPDAANGNSILNGSDDAVRAGELFAPAPMPESHLLVLHRDATLGANTHPCHPARSPSPLGRALGQTLGLFLKGGGGPWRAGCCAQGCTPKLAAGGKDALVGLRAMRGTMLNPQRCFNPFPLGFFQTPKSSSSTTRARRAAWRRRTRW